MAGGAQDTGGTLMGRLTISAALVLMSMPAAGRSWTDGNKFFRQQSGADKLPIGH
jgi:hypothetical protein